MGVTTHWMSATTTRAPRQEKLPKPKKNEKNLKAQRSWSQQHQSIGYRRRRRSWHRGHRGSVADRDCWLSSMAHFCWEHGSALVHAAPRYSFCGQPPQDLSSVEPGSGEDGSALRFKTDRQYWFAPKKP